MNPEFAGYIANLPAQLATLLASPPMRAPTLAPRLPAAGVYLFSENGTHLYVGRTNDLRQRIQTHGRDSSHIGAANFGFRLARETCGVVTVSYAAIAPEDDYRLQEPFITTFREAKTRIRQMDVRVVAESHPVQQMLLEAYVAVALQTPYNDFDNH